MKTIINVIAYIIVNISNFIDIAKKVKDSKKHGLYHTYANSYKEYYGKELPWILR